MDDDQQFCLRWNNHQSTLISVFDTLLEKGIHVDCTLAAEGQTLKAHKVVLSACSPYFESVLSQQYDKHPIIILKDVKFAELRAMMDYMYRGEVNISQDQLAALLKAAESLQIKGLSDSKPPPRALSPIPKGRLESAASGNINSREGSSSPLPRKRRKPRRSSLMDTLDSEMLNNTDTIPTQNHIANNPPAVIPKPPPPPPTVENPVENDIAANVKMNDTNECPPIIKNESTTDENETKGEICEEGTEDSVEDLTLDEEIDSEIEQSGPGPSHPQGDCVQSFAWHMDRAQDESTPSLDGQRESQESDERSTDSQLPSALLSLLTAQRLQAEMSSLSSLPQVARRTHDSIKSINLFSPNFSVMKPSVGRNNCEKMTENIMEKARLIQQSILQNTINISQSNIESDSVKCPDGESDFDDYDDTDDILLPDESEVFYGPNVFPVHEGQTSPYLFVDIKTEMHNSSSDSDKTNSTHSPRSGSEEAHRQFECRHCGKKYRWKSTLRRHENVECGGKAPSHQCPYCAYKAKQRGNLGVHIRKHHIKEWTIYASNKIRKSKKEAS